ncbi:CLUMA_CG019476, isoform A [Clunio marinus]|uniref:CLUMA_CG019476, isoform A n=1 Tax=Clunio marinus TaxID=568069 RepID=A0A1J1J417_9DIPT|nr:CLUMA_CG019476, isoform A [Clunio marinus]
MKTATIFCIVLIVTLAVQVREIKGNTVRSSVSVKLQPNGANAIFWHFIKPFIPEGIVISSNGPPTANNSSLMPASITNMSVGELNNSNAILSSNSNVSASIDQTFNAPVEETSTSSSR